MINFPLNLSKLSRGKGERKGSYIQVIYDDRDLNERNYGEFIRNHLRDESRHGTQLEAIQENRKLNLPKTFTTRKGPLLLFSEDSRVQSDFLSDVGVSMNNKQPESNELKSFKTTRNLRRSILEFGNHRAEFIYNRPLDAKSDSFVMERENTLETFSLFKEIKPADENQFEKIRPGFSAKRYLSNWTRHWRPELFENLSKEGRIKDDTLFEQTDTINNTKQRIDDDISRVPPAYRINRKWLTMTVAPLKGYRFYRVKTDLMGLYDETTEASVGGPLIHTPSDNIQVVDKDGNNIDYFNLSKSDKEIVLTELLLQTALQSIAEKRIESIEESLRKNIYPDGSQFEEANYLTHSDPGFYNNGKISVKDLNPNELLSSSCSNSILNYSNTPKTSNYLFPRLSGNKLSPIKTPSQSQPIKSIEQPNRQNQQRRSSSQLVTYLADPEPAIIESKFVSSSLQNFKTTTIIEEREEDLKLIKQTPPLIIPEINKNEIELPKKSDIIEAEPIQPKVIKQTETIEKPNLNSTLNSNQPIKVDAAKDLPKTNPEHHISLILPEAPRLSESVEATQLEIDPRILEEERIEEELLRKELEEEVLKKLMEEEEAKRKLKSDTTVALNEMLSKKHYQSTVSISNISIGDDFERLSLEKQALKKRERFILNRHNYHHPRRPKNKLIELYKNAKLPPNIQLGENVLFNSVPERDANFLIEKLVRNKHTESDKKKKSSSPKTDGKVIVLGPDGEITQIGNKLNENNSTEKTKKGSQILYRLFDEIPPYLYYTNKIDTTTTLINYERENNEKTVADQQMAAKKAADQILDTERQKAEEPILNKQILQALTNHAQQMAKIALDSHGSGFDLVKDIKNIAVDWSSASSKFNLPYSCSDLFFSKDEIKQEMALNENYKKLKTAFRVGEIDVKEFEEYTHLMKEALKTSLSELFSQSIDFSNVIIDDGLLGSLLEYPTSAFEIVTDPETRKKIIQIKKSYKQMNQNLANEMNLDLEQIENEVRNKSNMRGLQVNKDAKLETNVNTSKNASDAKEIEVPKKIDEEDENADKPKASSAIVPPVADEKKKTEEEEAKENENKTKEKKKKKKPKPDETKADQANDEEAKKNAKLAKQKLGKNKKDKKGAEKAEKAEIETIVEEENLDPKELKRRQQAEEKKKEMLRRRLEKEEEKRREEEELLRKENEARAAEEEKRKKEEELEQKRQAEREKQKRLLEAQQEREKRKREEEEAKRLAEEEAARKMEEMRIKFIEELTLKAKMEEEERRAEEQRKLVEQQRQYEAAEKERLEILRRQAEYEESERRRYEEENRQREEELERAINEAKQRAIEEAIRQAEYEKRMEFMNKLRADNAQFESSQLISRAFVFSYYEILSFLGTSSAQGKTSQQVAMEALGLVTASDPFNQNKKSKSKK